MIENLIKELREIADEMDRLAKEYNDRGMGQTVQYYIGRADGLRLAADKPISYQ